MRSILIFKLIDFTVANRFFNVTVSKRKFSNILMVGSKFSVGSFSAMHLKYEKSANLMLIRAGKPACGTVFISHKDSWVTIGSFTHKRKNRNLKRHVKVPVEMPIMKVIVTKDVQKIWKETWIIVHVTKTVEMDVHAIHTIAASII